ncbi:hypothetical protein R1sor_009869 [Riccia sorocarpa]|uniref:Uncharacterized protein n=1 Tax=Riccia sorocarpa TaxID=122646 RepID=A0ABD3HWB0_9MARC
MNLSATNSSMPEHAKVFRTYQRVTLSSGTGESNQENQIRRMGKLKGEIFRTSILAFHSTSDAVGNLKFEAIPKNRADRKQRFPSQLSWQGKLTIRNRLKKHSSILLFEAAPVVRSPHWEGGSRGVFQLSSSSAAACRWRGGPHHRVRRINWRLSDSL